MSQLLPHLVSALLGGLLTAAGWWTARSKDEGRREERESSMRERIATLEARDDKKTVDLNHLGNAVRELRTLMQIAGQSGQVPRFEPRRSGEGRSL